MNISIIYPLYNAEKYIRGLNKSLIMQENVHIESIKYILTESKDNTEEILKELNINYKKINKEEFSHSLTREKQAMQVKGDIIVFISQDVIIKDKHWLYNLTRDIISGKCEVAFSRQICEVEGIEKYTRPKNYPEESRIVSKEDIQKHGLLTFFFSDASSAIKKDVFIKLNGYDNKDLIINEDMYFAHKLITSGYRIKYCADSVVIHSHKFTYKQLFNRYFDTGVFFAQNSYLSKYDANGSGFSLAKHVFVNAIKQKDVPVILDIIPNFVSRFMGMKLGKSYEKISIDLVRKFSLNKNYWNYKI